MATCLIVLARCGNFAVVNAVAMEGQLNCKTMMLHEFTWRHFLVAAAVLTLVWYGLLFLLRRRKGKAVPPDRFAGNTSAGNLQPLPHQWETDVDVLADGGLLGAPQEPEGLCRVGIDEVGFAPRQMVRQATDKGRFLSGTVADFLEELKPVFDYELRYKKGRQDFLAHLLALIGRYPAIRENVSWPDIVAHISELVAEQLAFNLSGREIDDFLGQEGVEFEPDRD